MVERKRLSKEAEDLHVAKSPFDDLVGMLRHELTEVINTHTNKRLEVPIKLPHSVITVKVIITRKMKT